MFVGAAGGVGASAVAEGNAAALEMTEELVPFGVGLRESPVASDLDASPPPREELRGEWVVDCAGDDPVIERLELCSQLSPGPGMESPGRPFQEASDVVVAAGHVRVVVVIVRGRVLARAPAGAGPPPECIGDGALGDAVDALKRSDLAVGRRREAPYDGRPPTDGCKPVPRDPGWQL